MKVIAGRQPLFLSRYRRSDVKSIPFHVISRDLELLLLFTLKGKKLDLDFSEKMIFAYPF